MQILMHFFFHITLEIQLTAWSDLSDQRQMFTSQLGHLAVLPRKDLAGEMHLEIDNSFQKVCFYTCYKSQMPRVPLSFLWLWKEEYESKPGTATVLMADMLSQVGRIPIPESLPDNNLHRAIINLYLMVKQRQESFMSFILLKQWC